MLPQENRVDVHVLKVAAHARYHRECFASLLREPINLHLLDGSEGDIGQGRYEGFRQGEAEFVSYVDDDDYVKPGVFRKCVDLLDARPEAIGVVTNEERVWENGEVFYTHRPIVMDGYVHANLHQLKVWRRELILPYTEFMLECPYRSEHIMVMRTLADGHRYVHLDEVGYVWRNYPTQSHRGNAPCEKYRGEIAELQRRARANR